MGMHIGMKTFLRRGVWAGAFVAATFVASGARADNFELNYEAPGVENSTATFSEVGVETFNNVATGMNSAFTVDFGNTGITGTYSGPSGVQIMNADQYGGAGGAGKYAVAFGNDPYSLTLNQNVNYFGYWLSALDQGNVVTFYNNGVQVGQVTPKDVSSVTSLNSAYYGNPNANFKGQDSGEPFAFINFYDTTGSFNEVVFTENPAGGGYESDNQTVGVFIKASAASAVVEAPLPLPGASPFALVTLGVGLVVMLRRDRKGSIPFAQVACSA